jgi:hypothetical protein
MTFRTVITYQCHSDAGKLTIAALCSRGCYAGGIVAFVGGGGGEIALMSIQEFVLLARVTIPVKNLAFFMRIN